MNENRKGIEKGKTEMRRVKKSDLMKNVKMDCGKCISREICPAEADEDGYFCPMSIHGTESKSGTVEGFFSKRDGNAV